MAFSSAEADPKTAPEGIGKPEQKKLELNCTSNASERNCESQPRMTMEVFGEDAVG